MTDDGCLVFTLHFSGFYEERAILLGRLGRHEQALSIYIHTLNNIRMAEE